ncbi:MAG: chromosome segregation ATPase [Pseudoalteromonas tetraodonis]|jgi:chromosome segregation ATPase
MPETDVSKSNRLHSEEIDEHQLLNEEDDSFMEPDGEIEPAEDVSEDDELLILSPLTDEFDEKVAEAQEQLLHLRHQQEQLEKQKAELEELKRKREKFVRGRAEATDRLTKATTMLEREMFESKKRLEQLGHAHVAFERHLEILDRINPEDWVREEMRSELSRALAAIQDAREEYTTEMARVGVTSEVVKPEVPVAPLPIEMAAEQDLESGDGASGEADRKLVAANVPAAGAEVRDFMYWLKSGFAFTLPLLVFGIFALVLVLMIF